MPWGRIETSRLGSICAVLYLVIRKAELGRIRCAHAAVLYTGALYACRFGGTQTDGFRAEGCVQGVRMS